MKKNTIILPRDLHHSHIRTLLLFFRLRLCGYINFVPVHKQDLQSSPISIPTRERSQRFPYDQLGTFDN